MPPRIGPLIRSHSIGGPACRTVSRVMPGTTSIAGRTSIRTWWAARILSRVTRFAASTASHQSEPRSPATECGRQSTRRDRNTLSAERRREELGAGHHGPERIAKECSLRRHRVPRRSRAPSRRRSDCSRTRRHRASGAPPPGARGPAGSSSVPTTCATIARSRPRRRARASPSAGRSAPAGSAWAQSPSTRSSSSTETLASSPAATIAAFRWLGSMIGCGRPRVYSSAPKSTKRCRAPSPTMRLASSHKRPAGEEPEDRAVGGRRRSRRTFELADAAVGELDRDDRGLVERGGRVHPLGRGAAVPQKTGDHGLLRRDRGPQHASAAAGDGGFETMRSTWVPDRRPAPRQPEAWSAPRRRRADRARRCRWRGRSRRPDDGRGSSAPGSRSPRRRPRRSGRGAPGSRSPGRHR